jgi:hypothetical protein
MGEDGRDDDTEVEGAEVSGSRRVANADLRLHIRCKSALCATARPVEEYVKVYLTDDQVSRLLCVGGRCNLLTVRSNQSTEHAHMNNIQVIERVAEGLLAVTATVVSVLVFQFAMLVG